MKSLHDYPSPSSIKLIFFDFDGVFTDNSVLVDENGMEFIRCSRYDGFGLKALDNIGIKSIILTTETKPLARRRSEKLNIECHDSIVDKLSFADHYVNSLSFSLQDTAFFGNDINDLPLLQKVGFPIVTPDSHSSVHSDDFFVTSAHGGRGCVREVADFLAFSN